MYTTPQQKSDAAQKSRTAQMIVTGIVALVIVGWFFRESNLLSHIKNLVWDVRKTYTSEAQLYIEEGVANHLHGDYQAAVESFTHAIELEPKNSVAYNGRSKSYNMLGDWDHCWDDINTAVEVDPENAENYFDRAYMFLGKLERSEVYADLAKAIELDPDYYGAHLYRAMLYEEDQKWEEAVADYEVALNTKPDGVTQEALFSIYMGQANSYWALHMYSEAVANFETLFKQNSDFAVSMRQNESQWQMLLEQLEPGSDAYNRLEALIKKAK